jgi:hypothetical protein
VPRASAVLPPLTDASTDRRAGFGQINPRLNSERGNRRMGEVVFWLVLAAVGLAVSHPAAREWAARNKMSRGSWAVAFYGTAALIVVALLFETAHTGDPAYAFGLGLCAAIAAAVFVVSNRSGP